MRSDTVMIIEDEKPSRTFTARILWSEGYSVVEAENGSEALDRVEQVMPQVVLCDVNLGDMSGFAVLDTLRQNPRTQSIPFIFLSGRAWAQDFQEGLHLRADQFLLKPVIRNELIAAVAARIASPPKLSINTQKTAPGRGAARAQWIYETVIKEKLTPRFDGWWVAIDHDSGKCFLGQSERDALRVAQHSMPDGQFLPVHFNAS